MTEKIHVKHRATARVLLVNEQNQVFMLYMLCVEKEFLGIKFTQ
jgi:hypothetical protein